MAEENVKNDEVDYKAEFEKLQSEFSNVKKSLDKASSEVADYKRKERERLSEDEKKTIEAEERETYYKGLERRIAISDYEAELDDITDAKIKREVAELFADGKIVEGMAKHKAYRVKAKGDLEKQIKDDLMKKNPPPTAQTGNFSYKSKEEIMAIKDTNARQKAIAENLELFQ